MKKAVLSIAMFAAFSGAANAAIINVGSVTSPSLGNPLSSVTAANLNQVYFFNLTNSAGSVSASFNSDPIDVSMIGKFYMSDASGNLGSLLANFAANKDGNVTLSYGSVTTGYYAFQFTSPSASQVTYSGQFSARVPAPSALGLVGLGLVGLGFFSRRRAA